MLYYLYRIDKYDNNVLRTLYKYQYYLTKRERKDNPEWSEFIHKKNELYDYQSSGENDT